MIEEYLRAIKTWGRGHNSSKRHTFFGRGNPQEQVSLGRENYTQEHALSLGG